MVQRATYDQVVALIRLRMRTVVLLFQEGEPLCARSLSVLSMLGDRFRARGYLVFYLPVDEHSSHYEETACVRVPQLRVFEKGRCKVKLTGLLSYEDVESLLSTEIS